jgi:hypothetical protein
MIKFGFYLSLALTIFGLCFILDVTHMLDNRNLAIFVESVALYLYSVFIAHNAKHVKWW